MNSRYLLAGLLLLAATILLADILLQPSGYSHSGNSEIGVRLSIWNGSQESYQLRIAANTSAFEALDKTADVSFHQYSFGRLITEINGIAANGTHNWFFFVNGQPAPVGADSYYPQEGDSIEFKYLSDEESRRIFEAG